MPQRGARGHVLRCESSNGGFALSSSATVFLLPECHLHGRIRAACALSCAACYNIRWLLRAIARLGTGLAALGLLLAAILRWLGTSPPSAGSGNPFVAVVGLAVDWRSIRALTQN